MIKLIQFILSLFKGSNVPKKKPVAEIKHDVIWEPSQHFSSRKGTSTQLIVMHWTGGTFKSCVNWFRHPDSKVSAHYVISKKGEIVQMVSLDSKAWHAGRSSLMGYPKSINRCSIGIELEGPPTTIDLVEWPEAQLKAAAWLCSELKNKYPEIRVTDHATVAPTRKVDVKKGTGPNKFPWKQFVKDTGLKQASKKQYT